MTNLLAIIGGIVVSGCALYGCFCVIVGWILKDEVKPKKTGYGGMNEW